LSSLIAYQKQAETQTPRAACSCRARSAVGSRTRADSETSSLAIARRRGGICVAANGGGGRGVSWIPGVALRSAGAAVFRWTWSSPKACGPACGRGIGQGRSRRLVVLRVAGASVRAILLAEPARRRDLRGRAIVRVERVR